MANRLVQIVTATATPAGGTVVIPHSLNLNGRALIPDYIYKDNPVFEGVAATSADITVQNDSDAAATGNFYLFYDHTIQRVFGTNGTNIAQLTPAPFWVGGSGSVVPVVAGPNSNCFVFQPGGAETGPVVFNDWADLMTALDALRATNGGGCYSVEIDDSLAAATIPAGGPYDFTDTMLKGAGNGATVTFADGTSFTGLRSFQSLIVVNANATTAPITDVVNGDVFWIRDTVLSSTTGLSIGIASWNIGGGGAVTAWLLEGSAIGGAQTGRVFGVNGVHTFRIMLDDKSSIAVPAALAGGGTSTLQLNVSSMIQTPTTFANWGSGNNPGPLLQGKISLRPIPYLGSAGTTAQTAPHGYWARLNSTGGNITQTLPAIGAATLGFTAPGVMWIVTDEATEGTGAVTVTADGSDTINGGGAAGGSVYVPRGGGIVFVSNGVSKWNVVSMWGYDKYQPAEIWFQDNVAASQTNVALGSRVSTLFSDWVAPKSGAVVGIVARFNAAVTAGTAQFTVTINGTPGTLNCSFAGAGTIATASQIAGSADRYAAGDLLGIAVTTDGSFAPTTDDVEAYLVVAENP